MGNYSSSFDGEETTYKVRFGNKFLSLNKKTTSENLQVFDKNLEDSKSEIKSYLTKNKKDQSSLIRDIRRSVIQSGNIFESKVNVVNGYSYQEYLDMFDVENDKFIINLVTEMKSFENTRNIIAETIERTTNKKLL